MITLFGKRISDALNSYKPFRELVARVQAGEWPVNIRVAASGLQPFLLWNLQQKINRPLLIVTPTEQEANELAYDLSRIGGAPAIFEHWNTVPCKPAPENSTAFGRRSRLLDELVAGRHDTVVAGLRAARTILPTPRQFCGWRRTFRVGDELDPSEIAETLTQIGYQRVPTASVRGEFSVRGEVLDIMPPAGEHGVRFTFGFDGVEEIRSYDPGSQSTIDELSSADIFPVREVVWDDTTLQTLRENASGLSELAGYTDQIVDELATRGYRDDEHLFYPLALSTHASILDYLPDNAAVVFTDLDRVRAGSKALDEEFETLYRQEKVARPVPRPNRQLLDFETFDHENARAIRFAMLEDGDSTSGVRIESEPPRSFFGNIDFLKEEIETHSSAGYSIYVFADTEQQAKRIEAILGDLPVEVIPDSIGSGFALPDLKILVIEEQEIFGRRRRTPKSVKSTPSSALESFVELNPGDYVVHVNYGIGRFCGIERLQAGGNERDYIHLEFAGEEFVYIPIEQVNLIQRYIGSGDAPPRLDKIGGKSWDNRKNRVKKSVEDLAERLITLYGRRQKARGFAFPEDTEWQLSFEASFPYEETPDQLRCIEEVKADMEDPKPMDRLVCGDVGYGKTEIAMRAAFKAITHGKQVAFLAPTTILSEQHYETAVERMKGFPVRIGMLSRFVSTAERKRVLADLASGAIDMVIGTHRVIQKDVQFRELGLLVIDEEQRFGVKDKERLKELRTNVDALTLTATPIPRTLHMSLLKIRDMSVLRTPPHNRLPIETHISEFDEETLARAIRREVQRGGQVYFLHNRVDTLEKIEQYIRSLVPEVMVEIAHGKMSSRELEDIMHRFVHGGSQVLVATTIIENGLDIPNVNTIIIDRADMYGISQLYQLRGRVGRSDRLAYAYLFYPDSRALSEIAMKRLQVISDYTELGSGFKIALKDLEVRGAGNLLGRQQSGDILSVGFDMYLRLLDDAVRRMSQDQSEPPEDVLLDLEYSGFIPDSYVSEPADKMEVYKKIAGVGTQEELDSVYAELTDRFGPLPEEVQSLLSLAEIRILCKRLHVASLRERKGRLEVEFAKVAEISVDRVLRAIKNTGGSVRLDPNRPNVLVIDTEGIGLKEKSEFIRSRLSTLVG
ncbi:MAG: transcription-repair coupling factor [Spirochaetales bacterium]